MLRRLAAAAPVLHAAQHRRGRGDETPEAGEDAGLEIRRMHRRSLDRPDQFYQARQRANGRVGRREFRVGPLAAEPARFEMDEAGIALLDRREIERRAIRRIDIAAIEQDVAAADQFRQARRCVRIVRVERDARLVEIEKCEPGAVPSRRQRRGAAKRVTLRRLDLAERSRRNRRTGARNSSSRRCSRSRQSADATTRPSRFLMAQLPAQAAPVRFLLPDMKPCWDSDASGILFRFTEYVRSAQRQLSL